MKISLEQLAIYGIQVHIRAWRNQFPKVSLGGELIETGIARSAQSVGQKFGLKKLMISISGLGFN